MAADPGGIFASDDHRRVQASTPNPDDEPLSVEDLMTERIAKDDFLNHLTISDVVEILKDLEADGDAESTEDRWKNTELGFKRLTGPIANEPPSTKSPVATK